MDRHLTHRPVDHDAAFWAFHDANPEVFWRLVRMTRNLKSRGRTRVGMAMLFEVLRWEHAMDVTVTSGDFKLNNNYKSRYARLIMERCPDLQGIFEIREMKS